MDLQGTLVFASGKAGDFDIWTLNLETKDLFQLTHGQYWNDMPKWSPDGKQIVFVSSRTEIPELWLMDADGSNQRQLTKWNKYHSEPSWSPDGKQIVFAGNYDDPDNIDIYTIKVDGSEKPQLLISNAGWEAGPSFSPDGGTIAFSSTRAGSEDIWEYDLGTKNFRQVTSHPARDYYPAYSPDGRWLAFISEADENSAEDKSADSDVWMVTRDGMTEQKITVNAGADRFLAWSPCGNYIACCSTKKGHIGGDRLHIISVNSGELIDFDYDRSALEGEIDASDAARGLISRFFPQALRRRFYPDGYFGSERYPHWKA